MKAALLLAFALAFALAARAENWPRFRGPTGQGVSSEKNLPLEWSPEKGICWKTPITGEGWSSPIVWGDRVFVTTVTEAGTQGRVLALDRASGRVLWDQQVFELVPLRKESKNSYATPTPVTDGRHVFAVFGDGSMAALDFAGGVVWTNREVQFYSRHGLGASPTLHEGLLIMPFDGSNRMPQAGQWPQVSDEERLGWQIPWDKAFVAALDAATGRRVWTGRRGRSRIAHVTPNVLVEDGRALVISPAGDAIQAFDAKTGELVWTVYSQGEGVTPGFVLADGIIITASGFEKTTLRAVKSGGKGDVTATHIAWEQRKGTPNQPSLLFVKPHLYTVTDGGVVHCFDAATGEVIYAERIGGNHSASPVYADGRIYFLSETGESAVIAAGPEFKILARNSLGGERCQASIAVSQGCLFIRSDKHLFCIGQ